MAGMFYEYFDGYLRVTFRNGPWPGDIEVFFHLSGDTVATTPCDDDFEKGDPQIAVAEDVVLRCWTSSSMSRFFQSMVSWLEAVTCNVEECAFSWDGEGPEGELRWFGGPSDSGTLRLAWRGRHDSPAFERKVRLEKNQMVQTLYQSFREFVESDRYDPISYEKLLYGEVIDLVLIEGRETLVRELAVRDRPDAYALVQTIMGFAYEYKKGFPRRSDLAEFLHMSKIFWEDRSIDADEVDEQIGELLDKAWNAWTFDQRSRFVEDELFLFGAYSGFGENLRKLRSPLLEAWLPIWKGD
jgi:hypothetical protein